MKFLAQDLRKLDGYVEILSELELLAKNDECHTDFEQLSQRLTLLEEKMMNVAYSRQSEAERLQIRNELTIRLDPYRNKMTRDQLSSLEDQYFEQRLLDIAGLPRLSLFYARNELETAA